MKPTLSDIDDVCRAMLALLWKPGTTPMQGVGTLTRDERLMLLSTCAARIIEQCTCEIVNFNKERALDGLHALMPDMAKHIQLICNDANAHGKRILDLDGVP